MNPEFYRTPLEKEIYQAFEKLTDRELQEKQALYLRNIEKNTESIKNNVQFWFYLTISSIIITVLFFVFKANQ